MSSRDVKGRIFNIQKFSVHDGPGVRTIVFLKGCRLRCRWCCNPESQAYEIQDMVMGGKNTVVGRDVTVGEVIDDVMRDEVYFRRSGGGLTLSGGEMLCQPEFSEALLKEAKRCGITTAVESTGFAEFEVIERLLPFIDTYLMDIKHMDSEKHREFTSQPNELILENAKKIAEYRGVRLIVRVPVIPGFNDTAEEIAAIAEFAAALSGVEEIHLLPYHSMGKDKYAGLGRKYLMDGVFPPPAAKMNELKRAASRCGIRAQIGG